MIPYDVPWDKIDGVDPGQPNDVPVCEEVVPNKLVVRSSGYVRNAPLAGARYKLFCQTPL